MAECKIVMTVSCLAAISLVIGIYAVRRRRRNPSVDGKPQKKFKRVLADNSCSSFQHHKHRDQGDGAVATGYHPYGDRIRFLLEHPPHPLKFCQVDEPLNMEEQYTWVHKRSELEALSQLLSKELVFAVDTEQHSLRSFLGFTALIQLSTQEKDYLLDTIALHDDMSILCPVFADPAICKVFHGADSDILWLQRDFHIYVVNLFDTARACDVLGKPYRSLAYLLQTYCGISTNKIFQRADWRLRPLPDVMVQYARTDVHYLLYIADCLCAELNGSKLDDNRLHQFGRSGHSSLFEEAAHRSNMICLQMYEKDGSSSPGEAATSSILSRYYSSQGSASSRSIESRLKDGRFWQLVRKLCIWRDFVARAEDESLRFVLSDQAILFLARAVPTTPQKIYDTISTADSIVQPSYISSFMTPLPSPSPVVYRHINNLCNLLKEDLVNLNGSFQERNGAHVENKHTRRGNYPPYIKFRNSEEHVREASFSMNAMHAIWSQTDREITTKQSNKHASRAQFVRKFSCKSPVYHNCRIYASDGRLLCYCDRRKLDWYIRRGLAELMEDDPPAIKLLFEPKGRPEDENNEFYIQSKKNLCVGCGESNHYLRYRIIPSCYRMHFPEHLKSHRSHDIVLLCVDCHEIAHSAAERHKRQVAAEFGIPLFAKKVVDSGQKHKGIIEAEFVVDGVERGVSPLQLRIAAMALLRHGSTMPKERHEELELVIKEYFGGRDITQEDLEAALLVGMGPREKKRLSKKRGLVLKHATRNSSSQEGDGCPRNCAETTGKHSLATDGTGTGVTAPDGEVQDNVLPNFVDYEDTSFIQGNQKIQTAESYMNATAFMDEGTLLSGVDAQVCDLINSSEIGESSPLQSRNDGLGQCSCQQREDGVRIIDAGETGDDKLVEQQYHSSSSSSNPNPSAGTDDAGEELVEPIANDCAASKRAQKISLLGHGPHGKRVVEKLLEKDGEDGIRQFCQRWRLIFVEAIKPRFLPSGWDIQHSGRREFGEYSVYNPSKKEVNVANK